MTAIRTTVPYALILWTLLFLFCLRVIGQMLVAFLGVTFLPPMEEWFSGFLAYPILLTAQFLIIAGFTKILCLELARRHGRGDAGTNRQADGTQRQGLSPENIGKIGSNGVKHLDPRIWN